MQSRFEVLDSFRGLAAIFIILYHLLMLNSLSALSFFRQSNLFVVFFFILSGFVLAHSYAFRKELNFKKFFISRTFRIFPLHIIMLLVFILLELGRLYAYNRGFHFNTIPFTGDTSINEILPNLTLLQSWLPHAIPLSWNSVSWSISVEYYLYMIFFLSLFINNYLKYFLWFFITITMLVILFHKADEPLETIRGLAGFFSGALTYLIYKLTHSKVEKNKVFFTILELIAVTTLLYIMASTFENKVFILSFIFCFFIYIFSFESGYLSSFFKKNIFLYIGKLSYSIYLTHSLILFLAISTLMVIEKISNLKLTTIHENQRYIDLGNSFYNNILLIIIVGVVVFISHFTYKYIEQKGISFGKNLLLKKEKTSIVK